MRRRVNLFDPVMDLQVYCSSPCITSYDANSQPRLLDTICVAWRTWSQGSDFDIGVSCRVKDQLRIEIHEMRAGWGVGQGKPSLNRWRVISRLFVFVFIASNRAGRPSESVCVSWRFGTFFGGSCRITLVNSYPIGIEKESPLEAPAYVPALP